MWYQAMDRTLTEEEVSAIHRQVAARLAAALPVRVIN
jgi:phenylalanyl-tRNA synthetase beta subunit